jgi:hypothetical protein
MILFPKAGSASLLDQGNPLFVGHVVDMPYTTAHQHKPMQITRERRGWH